MTTENTAVYTQEQKIAFIRSLYCPARQCADETGCSWALILAQAAQETGWGEKVLPGTNNIFNIKTSPGWHGESRVFHVWEMVNGHKVWVEAPFRVYPSILDSLRDRQVFLKENPRYTQAGLYDEDVKGDLFKEALALKRGGYATDDTYPQKLQKVFDGATMQRAIGTAKADGCKGCLPTINVFVLDAARAKLANAKVRASQGANTRVLVTDDTGHVQIQATLSGGPIAIEVWSAHDSTWVAIEEKITPTSPPAGVTLIAPTLEVASSTEPHESDAASASAHPAPVPSTQSELETHAGQQHYTIRKGESLSRIARAHSISYLTLARLNGIASPYRVYPGQILKVPVAKGSAAVHSPPASHGERVAHRTARPVNAVHTVRYRGASDHPQTDVMRVHRAPWMEIAEHEFRAGVKRRGGANPDPHIEAYFSATSLGRQHSDNLAYCAAFVNWCLTRAGYRGNNSAGAHSLSTWGRATRGNRPAYGAVAVVHFPTGGFHVTFVNGQAPSHGNAPRIATLGGNQGHAHEVSHSAVPASWVTHYRFPVEYAEHDEDYELELATVDNAQLTAASTH